MSMKSSPGSSSYTHYFSYNISQETSIENNKIVRLAQEMADLLNVLSNEHTNIIFVIMDETRVDVMKDKRIIILLRDHLEISVYSIFKFLFRNLLSLNKIINLIPKQNQT